MRRASLIPVLLVLLALVVAGCGGSDNSSNSGSSGGGSGTSTPATTGGGSSGAGGGAVAVAMKNIQFDPKSTTVKVGQKVTWTNEDSVDHNVTSTSGEKIQSTNFGQGGTYSFTPTKAGTIAYVCTLHPGMEAQLVITK